MGYTLLMSNITKWSIFYILGFMFCLPVTFIFASRNASHFSNSNTSYLLFLSIGCLLIIFIPFYILICRGFLKSERQIQLAIGKSFLEWFILSIIAAMIAHSSIGNSGAIVYLLNLIISYAIIWKFKLPMGYIFISVIIPWLSIFYLLVIGKLRNTDKSSILV